jgi:hypothetical protein
MNQNKNINYKIKYREKVFTPKFKNIYDNKLAIELYDVDLTRTKYDNDNLPFKNPFGFNNDLKII